MSSVFPKTMISTLSSVIIFTGRPYPPIPSWVQEVHTNGIMSITIHITGSKIHISYSKNHDSTLMLIFYYFYVTSLQPSPISLLRVHLIGTENVTSSQRPEKLRLFLQNTTCTYDLAIGTAHNNLNGMHAFLLIKIIVIINRN
jgi:hypothetical protein